MKGQTTQVTTTTATPQASSMSMKYCDHFQTHGCSGITEATVKLCDTCQKGGC